MNSTKTLPSINAPNVNDADVIGNIMKYIMIVIGVTAVVIVLYSAFLMLTSNGEPDKFKRGRQALLAGVIGLAISILGGTIVQIIINSVG